MSERIVVNLGELATLPGFPNEHGLRRLMKERRDFPVLRFGSKGESFEFDLVEVCAWWKAYQGELADQARQRVADTAQAAFELLGPDSATPQDCVGNADRKQWLEAQLVASKLTELKGRLVHRDSLEAALFQLQLLDLQYRSSCSQRLAAAMPIAPDVAAELDRLQMKDHGAFAGELNELLTSINSVSDRGVTND